MTASEIIRIVVTVGITQLICDLIANWRIFNREPYQRALGELSRAKAKLDKEKAVFAEKDTTTNTNTTSSAAALTTTALTDSDSKKEGRGDKLGKKSSTKKNGTKDTLTNAAVLDTSSSTTKKGGGISKQGEKLAKRLQRVEDEYADAMASVVNRHTVPSMIVSLVFLVLIRILGAEYKGKIVGILPFVPYSFVQRLTARGIDFGDTIKFNSATTPDDEVTDVKQCFSFMLIYLLSTMSIKHYVHAIFGTHPPPGTDSIWSVAETPHGRKFLKAWGLDPDDLKVQ